MLTSANLDVLTGMAARLSRAKIRERFPSGMCCVDSCYISDRPSNLPVESVVTGGGPRGKRPLFCG